MVLKEATVGRIVLIGILLGLFVAASRPESPVPSVSCPVGTRDETLVSSGQTRQYRIFVPPSYRPEKTVPLVLGFHGNDSASAQFENYSGFSTLAASDGFIAVYPQGLGEPPAWDTWAGSQDVQFVRDVIANRGTAMRRRPGPRLHRQPFARGRDGQPARVRPLGPRRRDRIGFGSGSIRRGLRARSTRGDRRFPRHRRSDRSVQRHRRRGRDARRILHHWYARPAMGVGLGGPQRVRSEAGRNLPAGWSDRSGLGQLPGRRRRDPVYDQWGRARVAG